MNSAGAKRERPRLNRRAFLRGAAGVAVGLPFLESLPTRSAWALEAEPVFSLFICTANGVVPSRFFPPNLGPLTEDGLARMPVATTSLARHAKNLLFLKGIHYPPWNTRNDSHAEGSCMVLTARTPGGEGGARATSTGPSADVVIAERVQPGREPLTLYAGNKRNGYIAERLSFQAAGVIRAADDNPYVLYSKLVGLAAPDDGTVTPEAQRAARLLLESRHSIHDLVYEELTALMRNPRLSTADRQRLQQHFDGIRDVENTMDTMAGEATARCDAVGLETSKLEALADGLAFTTTGMIEDVAMLHMSLVALAFACNFNRTATLQWGDGTDQTRYAVPANADLNWPFHQLSHRVQSDSMTGNNPQAEEAHAQIDAVRVASFAKGLDHFASRGLADKAVVMWTNHIADGPSHSYRNLPVILWGNAGGTLKQAEYVDTDAAQNNRLLNTLISAAIQDTGSVIEDFGEGAPGQLDAIRA